MPLPRPPWLSPTPPWLTAAPATASTPPLGGGPVPVLDGVPGTPCSAAELVALRSGRYVPLFGLGVERGELRRALALGAWAFAPQGDPRAPEHTATFLTHPALGADALAMLSDAIVEGLAPPWAAPWVLGLAGATGASDALREQVARAFEGVSSLAAEVSLALHVGGGDQGTWREHYQHLRALDGFDAPAKALSVVRHWYDFVLARRWSGLDGIRSLRTQQLDAPTAWLAASAEWLAGDEFARPQMTDLAQSVLAPLQRATPRLGHVVAREMVELLAHPWTLRWDHLRCAAARDHAAVSIRQWLHAAAEERFFHEGEGDATATAGEFGELGPEPSRAGKAAVEARQVAGDFLLDWFVPERDARVAVDDWARVALRTWHRLRGAVLLDIALRGARADGLRVEDGRLVEAPP